jgi:hypothetical protein
VLLMDPFEVFDSPSQIEIYHLVRSAPGGRNATTGIQSPESYASPVLIKGNLDRTMGLGSQNRSNIARDQRSQDGLELEGELRLFTKAALNLNDRIEVRFLTSTAGRQVKTYRVKGQVNDYSWFEQFAPPSGRREWAIVLEDTPARPA